VLLLLIGSPLLAEGSGGNLPPGSLDTGDQESIGVPRAYPNTGPSPIPSSAGPPRADGPSSLGAVSQSPWFALVSGVASILGLLIPLYATQIRSIPFSLYRSFTWRKFLLISGGAGAAVFSAIKLLDVDPGLGRVSNMLSIIFSAEYVPRAYPSGYLAAIFCVLSVGFGLALITLGIFFDPVARARETIVREHRSLEEARMAQVEDVLARSNRRSSPSPLERKRLRDIESFFRHTQWRYVDVVLGPPPPTFSLLRELQTMGGETEEEA